MMNNFHFRKSRQGAYFRLLPVAVFLLILECIQAQTLITNRWTSERLGIQNNMPVSATGASDTWIVEKVGEGDYVRLKHVASGVYLHNETGKLTAGTIQPGWWSAMWTIKATGEYFHIINRWKGTYLHTENRKLEDGPLGAPGWWSAQWSGNFQAGATSPATTENPPVAVTAGKVTFVNPQSSMVSMYLVELDKADSKKFITKIGGMNARYTVDCTVGQVYEFVPDVKDRMGFNDLQLTIKQSYIGNEVKIEPPQKLWSNRIGALPDMEHANAGNLRASRHSFDLLYVDPIFIDYDANQEIKYRGKSMGKGGMRKQIFKEIQGSDNNWHLSNKVAIEKHFTLFTENIGEASTETKMGSTAQSFMRSFSANISASVDAKVVKGKNSAAFKYAVEQSSSQRNTFIYSKSVEKLYQVRLNGNEPEFTTEFIQELKNLPKPQTTPGSLQAAQANVQFQRYRDFVKTWGTHYPYQTTYGGMLIFMSSLKEENLSKSNEWGLTVKQEASGTIKGVDLGSERELGYTEKTKNEQGINEGNTYSFYKGGSGKPENWKVSNSDVQPVAIDLKRLHELLVPAYFVGEMSATDIAAKKAMLQYAIEEYLGTAIDNGQSLKPVKYAFSDFQLKNVGNKKVTLFGVLGMVYGNSAVNATSTKFWEKPYNDGLGLDIGQIYKFSNNFEVVSYPNKPQGGFYVFVGGKLSHWHWGYINHPVIDEIAVELYGNPNNTINAKFIRKPNSRTDNLAIDGIYTYTLPFRSKNEGDIDLTFKIQKKDLDFDF